MFKCAKKYSGNSSFLFKYSSNHMKHILGINPLHCFSMQRIEKLHWKTTVLFILFFLSGGKRLKTLSPVLLQVTQTARCAHARVQRSCMVGTHSGDQVLSSGAKKNHFPFHFLLGELLHKWALLLFHIKDAKKKKKKEHGKGGLPLLSIEPLQW